jgi:major curlin subunit
MFRAHILAGLLAVATGVAAVNTPAPAAAGGFSFTLSPKGKDAEALSTGLRLFSFAQSLKNSAKIDQRGTDNGAAVSQNGTGNYAGIFQRGRRNSVTVSQNGNNNTLGVFQFGRRNNSTVTQNGNGRVGLVFQGNW